MNETKSRQREVGQAVQAGRSGRLTQAELAERMTQRGWTSWRQNTVVAVESGDRKLSLLEADDVADILGVPLGQLLERADVTGHRSELSEAEWEVRMAYAAVTSAGQELLRAVQSLEDLKNRAKESGWSELKPDIVAAEALVVEWTPEKAVGAARAASPRLGA